VKLRLEDAEYPSALRELVNPPPVLTASGPLEPRRAIAIVGSREACAEAMIFAHDLAFQLVSAGILVVSGGAVGIDGAAHRGALAAGGPTWVVAPTGSKRLYPPEHEELFEEVAQSKNSRMIWSFDDHDNGTTERMKYRNGVLVALSEAVVIVQAHLRSGSRNAAKWGRSLGRPVWAATAAPWDYRFSGTQVEIAAKTVTPLCHEEQLFAALGLGKPVHPPRVDVSGFPVKAPHKSPPRGHGRAFESMASITIKERPRKRLDTSAWSADEKSVFSALSMEAVHSDKLVLFTGISMPTLATALLTLRLKDVVVESPDGFFRRKTAT
jgi:DNA processing protein